ncbi:glutamate--tRNA ligase [bacterium CG10_46_32]|nr:MAG: glutamate--tRNA ligase [bacterium CG10_46_32]
MPTEHKQNKPVRTRFAPSPTGAPHVGNIRTALFAWLFSRHNKGTFILRIEDTDQAREQEGSVDAILDALAWLGIDIDEGLVSHDKEKGDNGPYTQSKRLKIYNNHAKQLVDLGKAFYCFCSSERLTVLRELQQSRKEPPRYDGRCLRLDPEEVEKQLAANVPHVIRMKVPQTGETSFNDAVKGIITIPNQSIDYQVLLKSDGFPTYHLASVVDDHLMEITHIIRADEWLPSTPKHVLLYHYFGWELPVFAHLPIILGTDKSKLSKRHGAVSVAEYKKDYLPDALANYLAFLGWNPKTEQEIFSRDELIQQFGLEKINKNNPIFDVKKLNWLNSQYIQALAPEVLAQKLSNDLKDVDSVKAGKIVSLVQDRLEKLSDFKAMIDFLGEPTHTYDATMLVPKKLDRPQTAHMLEISSKITEGINEEHWEEETLRQTFFAYCEQNDIGKGDLLWPLRVAVTGLKNSPDVFGVMDILGKKKTIEHIAHADKLLS